MVLILLPLDRRNKTKKTKIKKHFGNHTGPSSDMRNVHDFKQLFQIYEQTEMHYTVHHHDLNFQPCQPEMGGPFWVAVH